MKRTIFNTFIIVVQISLFFRENCTTGQQSFFGIVEDPCRDSRSEFHGWETRWTKVEKSKMEGYHPSSGICWWLFGVRGGPLTLRFPSPSRRSRSTRRSAKLYTKRDGEGQVPPLIIRLTRTLHSLVPRTNPACMPYTVVNPNFIEKINV